MAHTEAITQPSFDMALPSTGLVWLCFRRGAALRGLLPVLTGGGVSAGSEKLMARRVALVSPDWRAAGFVDFDPVRRREGIGGGASSSALPAGEKGIWNVVRHCGHTTVPF